MGADVPSDLTDVERALRARRAELHQRLAGFSSPPERGAELHFGKRIGEGTTEAISRLTDIGVGRTLEAGLERVERALAKLDEGTYGTCDECGEAIPEKRLEAMPDSTLCVRCAASAPRTPSPRR
jgi:RNA polymerase-binding transcription factor